MIDIESLKQNPRTQYLAQEYEKLLLQEADLDTLLASDPSLSDMVNEERAAITIQKEALEQQCVDIEKAEQ
jgi:hypothetical protein